MLTSRWRSPMTTFRFNNGSALTDGKGPTMAEHVFYSKQRKGNEREITLQTAALLVGKSPTKQKRIRIKCQMPLSGKKMAGAPEWVTNAYEFVLKNHDTVT